MLLRSPQGTRSVAGALFLVWSTAVLIAGAAGSGSASSTAAPMATGSGGTTAAATAPAGTHSRVRRLPSLAEHGLGDCHPARRSRTRAPYFAASSQVRFRWVGVVDPCPDRSGAG